ncbi:MAG: D-2-hydroxyacid dehydrogenase [Dehalococcoidia bacterium]
MKVLVLSNFPIPEVQPRHVDQIRRCAQNYELVVSDAWESQVIEASSAAIIFGTVPLELFRHAPQLRWIQAVGAGIDKMLYPELVQSDVILTSEKGQVGVHLAEHAFALLLGITRGIQRALRQPRWQTRLVIREHASELNGRTLGIVGLGGTGRAVADRAAVFGMRVVAIDSEPVDQPASVEWLARPDSLPELLTQSDVVVICAPLTAATERLFNGERFAQMKPGSILINVTRGEIVDYAALIEALESGKLGGAGLDTAPKEPLPESDRLWNMENVIITPHVAGASPHRGDRIVALFCENLRRFQAGQPMLGVIDKVKGY